MTTTQSKLMTADDLLAMPKGDGRRYELIRGVLVEKMPGGDPHSEAVAMVSFAIGNYTIDNGYGEARSGEPGYRLERGPDTVRAPEVAWFAPGRLPENIRGYPELAPDLAVEIKAAGNSWPEMRAKAQMWLSYGSQAVWVGDPASTTITIYRDRVDTVTLSADDTLDGGELLPGFATPVWRMFRPRR